MKKIVVLLIAITSFFALSSTLQASTSITSWTYGYGSKVDDSFVILGGGVPGGGYPNAMFSNKISIDGGTFYNFILDYDFQSAMPSTYQNFVNFGRYDIRVFIFDENDCIEEVVFAIYNDNYVGELPDNHIHWNQVSGGVTFPTPSNATHVRLQMNMGRNLDAITSHPDGDDIDWYVVSATLQEKDPTQATISELPETLGSIYQPGSVGSVTFEINQHLIFINIVYGLNLYQVQMIVESTDFLNDIDHAIYYTTDDERFLYITYDEDIQVIRSDVTQNWTGFSVWNLSTNEIITTKKLSLYSYATADGSNVYTYLFIPNMIIDDLISISASFEYRYVYTSIPDFWNETKGVWQHHSVVLEKDQTNWATLPWQMKLYTAGTAAATVAAFAPPLTLPAVAVGMVFMMLAKNYMDSHELLVGYIDDMERITNPSVEIVNNMKDLMKDDGILNPVVNTQTNSLHKLYMGQFNKFGSKGIEINEDTFIYSDLVFETNGVVYTLNNEQIILNFSSGDLEVTPGGPAQSFMDIVAASIDKLIMLAFIFVGALIVKMLFGSLQDFTKFLKNLLKNPVALVMILGLLFFIYQYLI